MKRAQHERAMAAARRLTACEKELAVALRACAEALDALVRTLGGEALDAELPAAALDAVTARMRERAKPLDWGSWAGANRAEAAELVLGKVPPLPAPPVPEGEQLEAQRPVHRQPTRALPPGVIRRLRR